LVRVTIARSAAEMEGLRLRWNSLYSSTASTSTLFQSFAWNQLAARIFADSEQPFVVHAESESGSAIIPAAIGRDGTLATLLGETLFDYRDLLCAGEREALYAAWREIERLGLQFWVSGIRESSLENWQALSPTPFTESPCVSGVSADRFAHAHAGAARLLRRLQRKGVVMRQYTGRDPGLLRAIYEAKARQLNGDSNNLFADPRRIEFMIVAAAQMPSWFEIFTLESEGALLGGLVTLRDRNIRRFYTIYYDHAWSHWSPGTTLLFEVTRRSLADGLICDYMTGTQWHKSRFATGSVSLSRVDASPAQLAAALKGTELPIAA
jgi:CelD/BcsL family acetyltransferase involved in cellulose biosynthesis